MSRRPAANPQRKIFPMTHEKGQAGPVGSMAGSALDRALAYSPGQDCQCSAYGECECGCSAEWTPRINKIVAAWRDMPAAEMRLRCGELTAQEIRTVRAVLNAILANGEYEPRQSNTSKRKQAGQTRALALDSGSAFPTYAEMHKALDDLHIVCECATMPEVETWYRGDAFAKEARQRAIDVLCRHTYAEREREMLIGFREAVRRIAAKPIDSSDMMDEIEHLLSLPQNKPAEPRA